MLLKVELIEMKLIEKVEDPNFKIVNESRILHETYIALINVGIMFRVPHLDRWMNHLQTLYFFFALKRVSINS